MLRPGDAQPEGSHHTMGRAGDAPDARSLVIPRVGNDRISPQSGQARPLLSLRLWVSLRPMTRVHVTLLGPCFKTGQVDRLPQHHRLLALESTTHTTASQTNPSYRQACLHKQHDNQTRTRQPTGTHACTTSRHLRHTAQNRCGQPITPESQNLQRTTSQASELPAIPTIQSHKDKGRPV